MTKPIIFLLFTGLVSCSLLHNKNHGNCKDLFVSINEDLFGNLAKDDTLVFSNKYLGNDTIFIDSFVRNCYPEFTPAAYAYASLYSTYICGSDNRRDNENIVKSIRIQEISPVALIRFEKFADRKGQNTVIVFGESISLVPEMQYLPEPARLPGCSYTYNVTITADTVYSESSPFHIRTLYWSDSTGPVGFETQGGYIWYRTK